jgi:tripartite-type tricarboxylate transporter receptor subunit TctC
MISLFVREVSMTINKLALYAFVLIILTAGNAFSQADFYKGKTIKIIRGGGPGGSGEFQTRALMKFLEKYIPGQPKLMLEYIEGAAGRKATNVIYSSTRPDGLTIGSIGAGLVVGPILGLPGSAYDLDKLIYLGSTDTGDPYVFYTKASLGLDTIDKLRATSGLRFGAHSVGHPVYVTARFVAYLLNLKEPKFVTGFTGPEIYIAVTRGEVDAHATGAARFVVENHEWIEKKLVHLHTTLTVPKGRHHPSFAHLPELGSFAKSDTERKLLDMFRAFQYPRWPFIFPPGTPKEPVQIIREAMRKSFADPEFPAEFRKLMGDDPAPLGGEELQRAIKELPRDQEVVQLYKKLAGADPFPAR